jgi:hypothetical protein
MQHLCCDRCVACDTSCNAFATISSVKNIELKTKSKNSRIKIINNKINYINDYLEANLLFNYNKTTKL